MSGRAEIIRWVADEVLPHEADVRRWLTRHVEISDEADDIIQHAYARLADLDYVGHINSGRAYFFTTARSILLERIRRAQIVPFFSMTDFDASFILDDSPSPEAVVGARLELRHVLDLVDALPAAYRDTLRLRRLEGLSQKEAAVRLGVSEKVIENNVSRGLRMLLKALEDSGAPHGEQASEPARRANVSNR